MAKGAPDYFSTKDITALMSISLATDVKYGTVINGTAVIYTVPAGKVFYITGYYYVGSFTVVALQAVALHVRDALDALVFKLGYSATGQSGNDSVGVSIQHPLPIPAGWDFYIKGDTASGRVTACVWGYEDDA